MKKTCMSIALQCGTLLAALSVGTGCHRETNDDRQEISRHTVELAARVKAAPHSDDARLALDELIDILEGKWRFARCRAADAIGELGPLAEPALPHLMRAANSKDRFVEDAAVHAIASLGPTAAPAVDLLIGKIEYATNNPDYSLLSTLDAIRGLGRIGEPASKAIPVLERAAGMSNEHVAREAQEALTSLRGNAASKDEKVR